jgi:hypothetical protein
MSLQINSNLPKNNIIINETNSSDLENEINQLFKDCSYNFKDLGKRPDVARALKNREVFDFAKASLNRFNTILGNTGIEISKVRPRPLASTEDDELMEEGTVDYPLRRTDGSSEKELPSEKHPVPESRKRLISESETISKTEKKRKIEKPLIPLNIDEIVKNAKTAAEKSLITGCAKKSKSVTRDPIYTAVYSLFRQNVCEQITYSELQRLKIETILKKLLKGSTKELRDTSKSQINESGYKDELKLWLNIFSVNSEFPTGPIEKWGMGTSSNENGFYPKPSKEASVIIGKIRDIMKMTSASKEYYDLLASFSKI